MKRFLSFSTLLLACLALATPLAADGSASRRSGIDQQLLSTTVPPGENFYLYANQQWLDTTDIPADKSNYGIFTILDDRTRAQVRALIEQAAAQSNPPGSAAQKVGDLYQSVLHTAARDEAGIEPIRPLLAKIEAIDSIDELSAVLGELARSGVFGPFAAYVNNDAKQSDQYAVYLTQSGLTMPDRDYYLQDDERYVNLRDQAKAYIGDLLGYAGVNDPDAAAEAVFEIERQIAEQHWTKTENRDPIKTYNKKTNQELRQLLGAFSWDAFAESSGIDQLDELIIRQPSYFEALGRQIGEGDLSAWRNYLKLRTLDTYASSLSTEIERRHFDFHATAISGISEQEPLWKRGVNVTSNALGELVGQLYVEQHFTPTAKARMNELVENLQTAFAARIKTRPWMGDGTKKQALEKLTKFTTKIGYPDQWKDYSGLTIASPVLAENMIAVAKFEHQRELDKLGGPIDRTEWHMTPQTINAYYNPVMNEIVFPAAILQPPFFDLQADDAANYGAIGAVIGHELSHGFDDKGSKYDGDGNLRMWWTPDDRQQFDDLAAGLVSQYNGYEPVAGNFVNGELTLGENIGDLGGLSVAYEAYRLSLNGGEPPVIDGLTGDQRFFLGWAQIWRRLYREPELLKRLITDPHSPSEYRVNGIVRNMDAWYEAFQIGPADPLYLKPDERVKIW